MIRCLHDIALIKPQAEAPGVTPGGIHLPNAQEQQLVTGEVMRLGPGRMPDDGKLIEPKFKEGDKVIVARAAGLSIYVDGVLHKMMPSSQILAIVEE